LERTEELQKHKDLIKSGKLTTWGGTFLDHKNEELTYDEYKNFVSPPDVTADTWILSVCAIPQSDASPLAAGFFVSICVPISNDTNSEQHVRISMQKAFEAKSQR